MPFYRSLQQSCSPTPSATPPLCSWSLTHRSRTRLAARESSSPVDMSHITPSLSVRSTAQRPSSAFQFSKHAQTQGKINRRARDMIELTAENSGWEWNIKDSVSPLSSNLRGITSGYQLPSLLAAGNVETLTVRPCVTLDSCCCEMRLSQVRYVFGRR